MAKKQVVTHASFHQSLFIPGLGTLGLKLPSDSRTVPELAMTMEEHGLRLAGKLKGGKDIVAVVPYANVVAMNLAVDESSD